jgi:DNA-binding response OmpR family regulator
MGNVKKNQCLKEAFMYKILLVEDDPIISKSIKGSLESWSYEVYAVTEFQDVLGQFVSLDPELVIMDIGLPFFNGYHWCAQIRKVSTVPIIFVSSAGDNKPFDLSVLVAKVQALLRRTYAFHGQTHLLSHGEAILNMSDGTLTYQSEKLDLTKNELKILQVLFEHPGEVVSRSEIMNHLWDSDSFIDDNTLTVNMTRLRRKLHDIGLAGFIQTKKGIGYRI